MILMSEPLKRWTIDTALPFWSVAGVDQKTGGFFERMTESGEPDRAASLRVRVQARQIYVMSHAALLGWLPGGVAIALRAFDRLLETARSPDGAPGFVHLLHADGSVADSKRDSYDHAFIVLACAWLAKASGEARVRAVLEETLSFIAADLTAPDGSLFEGLPRSLPRRQNPQMHWFEAALGLHETVAHPDAVAMASRGIALLESRLYDPASATIGEYFDDDWKVATGREGEVIEPGHLAEWVWLLRKAEPVLGRSTADLAQALLRSVSRFSSPGSGLLVDEALRGGEVLRGTRRSWLQTELAKAHLAQTERGIAGAAEQADAALRHLWELYLGKPFAAGWIDQLDEQERPLAAPVSASTFYHIFVAVVEADRLS